WNEIGNSIGVTKQAAQQRFTPKDGANTFARFTERARRAVVQSQEEAREGRSPEIAPAHLVLGLLHTGDSIAMKALADQGYTPQAIRNACGTALPDAGDREALTGNIPFNAPARKALELTTREALRLGHNYIGTEH